MNKRKIFNDPVYGFISIHSDLIFDIIEQPVFQRLRRIRQMGLADYVYLGAHHTRFHHALGAMHLMESTLKSLCSKGHEITDHEWESALLGILLHDVGHGPCSHALEYSILSDVKHESLSLLIMQRLNKTFNGALDTALQMFNGTYPRRFFNQLITGQLDIDRLDYLNRDSFFTGVSEGTIGSERIIKMLDIVNDNLVVEEKGIYSIENFLNARRLMYWQVYLHKTAISAETMLIQVIRRARELTHAGIEVFASPPLSLFLKESVRMESFLNDPVYLQTFQCLDDYDIWGSVKIWINHSDFILSSLSRMLLERKLFRITLSSEKPSREFSKTIKNQLSTFYRIPSKDMHYLYIEGSTSNAAYLSQGTGINILTKKGKILDIALASDLPNIKAMSKIVRKYYACWAKEINWEPASL
ncbi:HD domain-containing protein [Cytophagaceae bacterium YF14B1]|uniref:HD domain-containing protein n=1 Tax=Xanthocytophaga flava TaxID=3048013 RepID=A0AAE3QVR4_9BACT|nr:HD domain-containing protein [Xanthocytophaga flavus]MDJ1483458.1 HD domain-containing protein [Xanthocytophaga flavus]